MFKKVLLVILVIPFFCCQSTTKEKNKATTIPDTAARHLNYLMTLNQQVAAEYWPDLLKKKVYNPMVYNTFGGAYVLQPNDHIKNLTDYKTVEDHGFDFPVIQLPEQYSDTTNLQFHNSITFNDSTSLNYKENVLFFQSFELTQKFFTDIRDIRDWSIMVIHELFHGYQRKIPEFEEYYSNLEIPRGPDKYLGKYHKELPWYKESVYQENEILKSIWIDNADLQSALKTYDSLRTNRINRIATEYNVDIREVEDYEFLMEGHARYYESLCKRYLAEFPSDTSMLNEEDRALFTDMFDHYDVTKDKALYNLYNDRYYYQLGYNIAMILEKYLPEYEESVYTRHYNFNSYLDTLRSKTGE